MRITLSIPDAVAHRFQAGLSLLGNVPVWVTRLLEDELIRHDDALAAACRAANSDTALNEEIKEWQSFDTLEE